MRRRQRYGVPPAKGANRSKGILDRHRGLGRLTVTFSDDTKATVKTRRKVTGWCAQPDRKNTSGGSLFPPIPPNAHMMSYQNNEEKLTSKNVTEKSIERLDQMYSPTLEEEWTRSYLREMRDFLECVTRRQPRIWIELAFETIKINYAIIGLLKDAFASY